MIDVFCVMIQTIYGFIQSAMNDLTGTPSTGGIIFPIKLESFDYISGTINATALTILSICIMLEFVTMLTRSDMMRLENIVLAAGKYTICVGIINAAPGILQAIFAEVQAISVDVSSRSDFIASSYDFSANIKDMLEGFTAAMGWLDLLVASLVLLIPLAVSFFAGLIIKVMVYAYFFELAVYYAIAPIPCAFFPYNEGGAGFNHTTLKFFRGFAAVCLQGTFMIVCLSIFGKVVEAQLDGMDSLNGFVFSLSVALLVFGLAITKCGGWAKSIMDAG